MVSLVNINCRFTFLFYVPHIWIFKILFSVTALQLKKNKNTKPKQLLKQIYEPEKNGHRELQPLASTYFNWQAWGKKTVWPIWTNSSSGKLLSRKIMCKIMTLLLLLLFFKEVPPNIISTDQTVQETKKIALQTSLYL